ncbi:MAG: radical SAM protein [Ruminococcus sp.]|jgi:radical SAM protein with 4Fe4S-binding SPASM domain|nr:radical SAM protein [Ruminococcus sp.]
MKYTFARDFLFRGFERLPFVGIFPYGKPVNIKPELLDTLDLCDGTTDIPEMTEELKTLIDLGLVVEGDTPPTEHQKYRYHKNRYFPDGSWQITGRCNYRCKHCFNAVDNSPIFDEFTLDEAKALIADFASCGVQNMDITGGEPTIHPNFMEILTELSKVNIRVHRISTNGSKITREMLSQIKELGFYPEFRMSFDGIGFHDKFRGHKGAEETTLKAIELLVSEGFPVKIEMNVNIDNIDTIFPSINLMDKMGVHYLRVIRTMETPRWVQNCEKLFPGGDYYEFALKLAEDYLKEPHKMHINVFHTLHIDPISGTAYTGAEHTGPYRGRATVCGHNRHELSVSSNGDLSPCPQMSGVLWKLGICLGNVKETPLQNLISDAFSDGSYKTGFIMKKPEIAAVMSMYSGSEEFGNETIADLEALFDREVEVVPKSYLDAVDMRVDTIKERTPRCANCKYFERCQGGCRLVALGFTGVYTQRDITKCLWFYGGFADRLEAMMKEKEKVHAG